jgi:NAD+ kinase
MKIAFLASPKPTAQQMMKYLTMWYGQCSICDADYVVTVGGDGTTLKALHAVLPFFEKPVFSMRLGGSIGFLGNRFDLANLRDRLKSARKIFIRPLKAEVEDVSGRCATVFGINEIVLSRQRLEAARLRVTLNGTKEPVDVIGDGLLIATPIGSTGYNRSAGGSILPIDSSLLALTGLAIHHACDWANAALSDNTLMEVTVIDPEYRPVRLETNMQELTDIRLARVSCEVQLILTLLLEPRESRSS